jgi:hypothetical protein
MREHLTYANVVATVCLVLILGGGVAYAANTVFSGDIVNGEVKTADIGTDEVRSVDVRNDNLSGGGLRGVDIANAVGGSDSVNADKLDGLDSSGLVQGQGRLLAARFIMVPPDQPDRTLFEIPGFGQLYATCGSNHATIVFRNTTSGDVDLWVDDSADPYHEILRPSAGQFLVVDRAGSPDDVEASTFSVGFGDDPGARRTATVHPFASQAASGAPCLFQAQGILWITD